MEKPKENQKYKQDQTWNPPGSLIYVGESDSSKVKINIIDYSEAFYSEIEVKSIEQCKDNTEEENTVTWVDIKGLNDAKTIEEVGKFFDIHRMWLEDVLNTHHLPKAEEVDDLLFIIMKAVKWDDKIQSVEYDQVSLFLGKNFVVSFHENPTDILEPVKARIRQAKGRIRSMKADYLFYALVDSLVDQYVSVMDLLGIKIEDLDSKMNIEIREVFFQEIRHLKNELLYLRKAALPLKDSVSLIIRTEIEGMDTRTRTYFKDVQEHLNLVMTQIDSYKELLNGLNESYNQKMNIKLNEVLRVLTIFTSIFSPLTFIVGVYGMNFKNFPELQWEHGYLVIWGVMILVVVSMLIFFKKKRWF